MSWESERDNDDGAIGKIDLQNRVQIKYFTHSFYVHFNFEEDAVEKKSCDISIPDCGSWEKLLLVVFLQQQRSVPYLQNMNEDMCSVDI